MYGFLYYYYYITLGPLCEIKISYHAKILTVDWTV